ncbi:MAG: peptidase T, partial [Bacteroidales bacterium]|nr:peptidase T [Bacteroidales bacterium]
MQQNILNRFLRYIAVDTQSNPDSKTVPSTASQSIFAHRLADELRSLAVENVSVDQFGNVMAKIPANINKKVPAVGFLAHIDTSPGMSGKVTHPQITKNYKGTPIVLNKEKNIVLSPQLFPELLSYKGQTIIHTDGTTLLGADDKAGIAEIMAAIEYIGQNPEFLHGDICIGFTPDEETGTGIEHFDVQKFGADYAYTVDGGKIGELEYENFNAAVARIEIQGLDIHPGVAKGKMINSQLLGMEIECLLPAKEKPEHTEGYEGFFLLTHFQGTVENTVMQYIIRDHDKTLFEQKKQLLLDIAEKLNNRYERPLVSCQIKDQYYNMREKIEDFPFLIDIAQKAMLQAGVTPEIIPVRGGTDGARLSFVGLPCPNIFAGGHNFHGKYEYTVLESMQKATETILNIIALFAE